MAIKDLIQTKKCLFICNGGSCMKKNAEAVTQALRTAILSSDLEDEFHTVRTKCMGRRDDAPIAMLSPDNVWLKSIDYKCSDVLIDQICKDELDCSENFLYRMGESQINSKSVPTNQKENNRL